MTQKLIAKKIQKATQGFTLIELLVVVSIIAILAVVSLSLFGNAQKVARDGVRRAEINAIAKSFESSRDIPNATYQYNTTYYNNDFGNSNPADPLGTRNYCIGINTTDTTPPAPPAAWTSGCPAAPFNNAFSDTWTMAAGTRSWTACASLEATTTPFCIKSIIR
ncbi:MAG: Fimbrial protein pilin [Candidatus Daviesbacteria bacterium GW2011_GWA1_41_61]|uniref:Fimbrial protein pilin n=1 Tax=Candidatus Daviesbacteria bacterium GW2011_GWA2_40_9 TaxID=1618424 RepID=A0A0G0U434_9BACT|nr:MAG: protein of unknown function with transmembrane region [Candidatus Daviesbacteria bacterium GW2011_GWC1_40_9]KKR83853.1 MAG: Fimbrial protein pilin [Candidatus Daviesbacteria bacterium GW2011_GWA2_40_9]KKR93462.1 MAG: Fimbrial protein pilin [Candidatus Daviesbacteria bacterium GW2011_GWB1_41_15]KKS14989.1 MAG: Fimbrial protein pilin [Candidatus Daviesbacteria bacterium GW2011_GWA1_41_61]